MNLPRIEVRVTPGFLAETSNNKYEYLWVKNYHDNSYIYIRRKEDLISIWDTQSGGWHPKASFKAMKNKDQLVVPITSDFSIRLVHI